MYQRQIVGGYPAILHTLHVHFDAVQPIVRGDKQGFSILRAEANVGDFTGNFDRRDVFPARVKHLNFIPGQIDVAQLIQCHSITAVCRQQPSRTKLPGAVIS